MLGYIVPDKPELKIREHVLYSGYYCGICKSVADRYGQIPRIVLNYDSVLLALVIAALFPEKETATTERCPVHPLKKRLIVRETNGIDYAADMMLLLAYFKLMDDRLDEGSAKAAAGMALLRKSYKKLIKTYPEKCGIVQTNLRELHRLETEKCPSIDRAAEPFAKVMEEIFAAEPLRDKEEDTFLLRKMGYHIGKWIYLIDAFDDIPENKKNGSYNPLLCGNEAGNPEETTDSFRKRIRPRIEYNLHYYLAELSGAWERLSCEKNKELIDNIVYFGLMRKTEQILEKGTTQNAKPI